MGISRDFRGRLPSAFAGDSPARAGKALPTDPQSLLSAPQPVAQASDASSILRLQGLIGNHATQRLLVAPDRLAWLSRSLQRDTRAKPSPATPAATQAGSFERIEDAYAAGRLDERQWANLVDSADLAMKQGDTERAKQMYLALYSDATKLAQASRVFASSDSINVVGGSKYSCKNAKPGLNLSLDSQAKWGANATTALVAANGTFGVPLNPRGGPQPEVAIVLTRSVFVHEKGETLGTLRHEMVHTEIFMEDAAKALASDPKDKSPPAITSSANTELLAHVEGFMTMFQLAHPAPDDPKHPAFGQLLGAVDTGEVHPWAEADESVKNEAERRLEGYYCQALDPRHREAFDAFVRYELANVRQDELLVHEPSPDAFSPGSIDDRTLGSLQGGGGSPMPAKMRMSLKQGDFFRRLQAFRSKCKATPSMKL